MALEEIYAGRLIGGRGDTFATLFAVKFGPKKATNADCVSRWSLLTKNFDIPITNKTPAAASTI